MTSSRKKLCTARQRKKTEKLPSISIKSEMKSLTLAWSTRAKRKNFSKSSRSSKKSWEITRKWRMNSLGNNLSSSATRINSKRSRYNTSTKVFLSLRSSKESIKILEGKDPNCKKHWMTGIWIFRTSKSWGWRWMGNFSHQGKSMSEKKQS